MEMSRKAVTKCWFRVFFLLLVAGLLAGLGVIGLIIGLVFTMPILGATLAVAYESLFPRE
jgi:hypothetical protein